MTDNTSSAARGCPICGNVWHEVDTPVLATCVFCQATEESDFLCKNGHYVCEECRTGDIRQVAMRICERSKVIDPIQLWDLLTSHGAFRSHGPQFHFVLLPIVAAVLRNRKLYEIPKDSLNKAIERLSEIPALSCAETGVCGAGAAAGAIVSLITKASPLSDSERRAALTATAKAQLNIARHQGGRCCRQSALATLESLWYFLRTELNFELEPIEIRCRHFSKVGDCKKGCLYHA